MNKEIRNEEVKNNDLQSTDVLENQINVLDESLIFLESKKDILFAKGYKENKHTIKDIQNAIDLLAVGKYHAVRIKARIDGKK